jgi:hypothetical protein
MSLKTNAVIAGAALGFVRTTFWKPLLFREKMLPLSIVPTDVRAAENA